jgi:hypothetical protein
MTPFGETGLLGENIELLMVCVALFDLTTRRFHLDGENNEKETNNKALTFLEQMLWFIKGRLTKLYIIRMVFLDCTGDNPEGYPLKNPGI